RPLAGSRRLSFSWVGLVPFFVYVALFLFLPTVIILAGSVADKDGGFTLANFGPDGIAQEFLVKALLTSLGISAVSAAIGAVAGALLAYAVASGDPRGVLRRSVTSAAGVLAQFGGVTLTFAFIATIGPASFVYESIKDHGLDIYANGVWLYELPGLILIYLYFQIPLMVIVFLPAVDGIRPQWREATESLGGGTWHYWRYVAGPLLAPSFLRCTFFLIPIASMFEFSTRGNSLTAPRNLDAWQNIVKTPELADAITASLELAAITTIAMLVLLLPTLVWVRLRFPASNASWSSSAS